MRILYPMRVKNRKNLVKGKCLVVCNHQSNADPVLLVTLFWRQMNYMAKSELFKSKIAAWFFKVMHCIPVDRSKVDLSSIKAGLRVLNNEKTLVIFPEGTRKDDSFSENIKDGAAMFAVKTAAPIVPMYFVKKPRLFCFNKLIIGEPIYLDEEVLQDKSKENIAKVSEIIETKMLELKQTYVKKKSSKKGNAGTINEPTKTVELVQKEQE